VGALTTAGPAPTLTLPRRPGEGILISMITVDQGDVRVSR
jgi:hypothetical protein